MKVIVWVEAAYIVEVDTLDKARAEESARWNWDTVYKHSARALDFPPQLSGRVTKVEAQP